MKFARTPAILAFALLTLAAACGPKLPPAPRPGVARYPDFVPPTVPPPLARSSTAAMRQDRGWAFLQANDLRGATREFTAALASDAAFYPAEAGLGYVALAQKDYSGALARFDGVLRRAPTYAPALVGRGDALLGSGRTGDAQAAFEAALAADPSLAIARQRVQVLHLRTSQEQLASARKATDAGRFDEARRAYERAIAASPESAFLYRDLGGVERRQGDAAAALASFRRAIALDPTDARSHIQIGEVLEEQGDLDGALQAYGQAAALEPSEALAARIEKTRARAALTKLPAEYAAIAQAARVTRADLAALIGVRFARLLDAQRNRQQALVTDARGSWAAAWILTVTGAGIMEVFPNHTFRPRAPLSRGEMARALARLLDLAAVSRPGLAARWQGGPPRIADVPPGHLGYAAVIKVVAAGVMPLFDDGTFRLSQIVSGDEGLQAVGKMERLVGANATNNTPFGERRR